MARSTPLTPALIAEAALRVGDRDGAKAMSMRRIAAELECDPMALYRHFPDRTALLDAVADLALGDVPAPDPALPWDARLRELVVGIRAAALRHPGVAPHIASRPPLGEQGRRLGVVMVGALSEAGLTPVDAVRASQALVAYIAAALAMTVQAGTPDRRWGEVGAFFTGLPGRPPGEELPVTGSDGQFEFGLGLLVAGIRDLARGGQP